MMKTDKQLQLEVEEELDFDPVVNSANIGVEVADRIVTLSGHPSSYAEKLAAEKAAQRVAGVKAVVIEMQVRLLSPSYPPDFKKSSLSRLKFRNPGTQGGRVGYFV